MDRRVLFLTIADERGASSRYRVYQFAPVLQAAGFTVQILPPAPKAAGGGRASTRRCEQRAILDAAADADVVVIQKRLFPVGFILRLRRLGRPLVFDFDDAIFTSPAADWSAPTRARVRLRLTAVLRCASAVVVGNGYLAAYARRHAGAVHVVPTAIDLARYGAAVAASRRAGFVVGWMGNAVNLRYLDLLREPLLEVAARVPDLRLVVVSDTDYDCPGIVVENRPWSEGTELGDLMSFDVGLMPLEDNPWTRGKCALKALQYMAAGVPAVCSAVGANKEVIDNRVDGILCASTTEWRAALCELAGDASLRRRLGAAGRAKVQERYCVERIAPRWVELLTNLR